MLKSVSTTPAILTDHKAATKSLTAWARGLEMPDGQKYTTSSLGSLDCALSIWDEAEWLEIVPDTERDAKGKRKPNQQPKIQKHKSSRKKGDGKEFPKREVIIAIRDLVMSDEWCNEPSIKAPKCAGCSVPISLGCQRSARGQKARGRRCNVHLALGR